ncbi:MAG: hypothetical protein QM767_11980 [Anaeromyxobacter sp.]
MILLPVLAAALMGAAPGATSSATLANHAQPLYTPYADSAADFMYNLAFCEPRDDFRTRKGQAPTPTQVALFSEPPDKPALAKLAGDASEQGRYRYLAYARLREAGVKVEPKVLLGVVIEVGLDQGLDTLAAYSDGSVRYINRTGKITVVEGVDRFQPLVKRLFDASSAVVARIGPWDQPRRPPPGRGMLRLSFLVSDGLYFGEGPMKVLERDPMAGPVFTAGVELLQAVVATAAK